MPILPPTGNFEIYLDWILNILQVVFVFGFIVFIHELGHFAFAKLMGVRVDKFSIGFGRKLLGFKWGETEYQVSILPLGGFVKMAGEVPGETSSTPEREFTSKKLWQRALIIGAGPVTNYLFAFPMAMCSLLLGVRVVTSEIGPPAPDSAAFEAGMRNGDKIVAIDGLLIEKYTDVTFHINFKGDNSKPRKFGIERTDNGRLVRIDKDIKPRHNAATKMDMIGVPPRVGRVISRVSGEARKIGLRTGDEIILIDGQEISDWHDMVDAISEKNGEPVDMVIRRGDPPVNYKVTFNPPQIEKKVVGIIAGRPALISHIQGGSPADDAGLRPDDLITSVAGKPMKYWRLTREALREHEGETIAVGIKRDALTVDVTIPKNSLWLYSIGVAPVFGGIPSEVAEVQEASPAAEAGLIAGDTITAVAGQPVEHWTELQDLLRAHAGKPVSMRIKRDSKTLRVTVPKESDWLGKIGIAGLSGIFVDSFSEGSKAAESGLMLDDEIIEANGVALGDVDDLLASIAGKADTADLKVRRDGKVISLTVTLSNKPRLDVRDLGFIGTPDYFRKDYTMAAAATACVDQVLDLTVKNVLGLGRMFSGRISSTHLAGPMGIFSMAMSQSEEGLGELLMLFVLISIGLALLNLMPIPVLDGGHLLFLFIELIRGRRLSDRVLEISQYAGLVMLLSLMVYATKNDIFRMIN